MDTPSLVIVGAPHFFSSTTLRPLGPNVTRTASARLFRPRSRPRRASSSYAIVLAIAKCSSGLGMARLWPGAVPATDGWDVLRACGPKPHCPDLALAGRECQLHF